MALIQLVLFAGTLYNLVLAGLILTRTHARRAERSFAWYIVATASWMAADAILQFRGYPLLSLWLTRSTFFAGTIIGISWIWFCTEFPFVSRRFRWAAWTLTLTGLPWVFLCWTHLLIPSIRYESWGVDAGIGLLVPGYTLWLNVCMLLGLVLLIIKRRQVRGLQRLQLLYILLGAIGITLMGAITNLILPVITHSTSRYAPLGPLGSLFVTTTTTYAIVRYRLMDIKIVLRAGLIYSVTIGMLSLLFALLVPAFNSTLNRYLDFPTQTGSFIMAFLIALAFQPLRRYVQHIVDQRFFKSVYDYRLTLREAGNALASARDRDMLVDTLISALIRTLRPRGVAVYLPGDYDVLMKTTMTEGWIELKELPSVLQQHDALLCYLLATDEVIVAEELMRQTDLQHRIGKQMASWGMSIGIPLIASARMCGVVFLGEKLSGDVYTSDDVGLLRILGKQAAIALDNARHFDEVVQLNEYHERLLHNMQDGVIALDPQQQIITFNPAAERILGVNAAQALGRRLEGIGITQFPLVDTGEQTTEVMLATPGDMQIPVLVSVTPFQRRRDTANSHLIVFRDLSALRALEQEKMQAERFSSMGAMAASLAHEIKNPLVPIKMFAHLLPIKYDDHEFREEFSTTVVKEVDRINRLVGQMLDMVRKPSHDRGVVDLREVIERLLVIVRPDCERNAVRVHTEFHQDIPHVFGVAGQLYQAILNVVTNAYQAMPAGGDLNIAVEGKRESVVCRITDTGPGVPQDDLARLFEPLYTTKVDGHGLGLALTYQFVRSNGGEINASCAPGSGLTITMTLPASCQTEAELLCT